MSTFRVHHYDHGFTTVARTTIRDEALSYRALGVLLALLDRPDDWDASAERVSRGAGREGRDAIRTAFKELRERGYVVTNRYQDDAGHWRTVTDVWEVPPADNPPPETGSRCSVPRASENQALKGVTPRTPTTNSPSRPDPEIPATNVGRSAIAEAKDAAMRRRKRP